MDDAVRVRGGQRIGELRRDFDGFRRTDMRPARDARGQRLALDVLEDDDDLAVDRRARRGRWRCADD